eukprot:CAMPEP_0203763452 /NCGR_PEP_ID=MMETSP0098-20131031/16204_1 /ASSEMBLY_ACC=CAM_ASM_000208 /TAXON_ID=96639 /ORGANISM=" , Strain NY0313808BC1" /LENGTH=352 /DNA_ID=CAMNT_0050658287 /DNA_START=695 /DNA_END=1750 /DNA_ORIENTATION=+
MSYSVEEKMFPSGIVEELKGLNPQWQHGGVRVKDPKASLDFYRDNFGMTLVDESHFGEGKGDFSLYFLATVTESEKATLPKCGTEEAHKFVLNCRKGLCFLQLTHNHGTENLKDEDLTVRDFADRPQLYGSGNKEPRGFGHFAFNTNDIEASCAELEASGVPFKKKLTDGRMKTLAFVLDPDGYWVEIVSSSREVEPKAKYNYSQTMIRIKDPAASIPFYRDLFGMELVSERHFDPEKGDFSLYFLANKTKHVDELKEAGETMITKKLWDPALELTWNHGTEKEDGAVYYSGSDSTFQGKEVARGFSHTGFLVDDIDRFCELLQQAGVEFHKRPQDGKMRTIAFALDPTGYW